MKKLILFNALLFCGSMLHAQSVFEKRVYDNNSTTRGDLVLKDVLIAKYSDDTDIVSTGDHLYSQEEDSATYHVVLVKHDSTGTKDFDYEYWVSDSSYRTYNAYSNSVAQDTGGYIMAGKVTDNTYHGSQTSGGGDILLLKTNSVGTYILSKRIHIGGDDVAYAIKPTAYSTNEFLVCGSSTKSNGDVHCFVMEIDNMLNVNWIRQMDLSPATGTATVTELFDVVSNGSNIWAVGSIRNTSSVNTDGLVVRLNTSGVYQTSRRVYAGINDKELFKHVEMDGSDLIIAGTTRQSKLFPVRHMLALQYITASNTVSTAFWLKSGANEDVGNDILKSSAGGTTNYFVVGEAIPTSGSTTGVLYKLNSSFLPISHKQYGGTGNSELHAAALYNPGSNGAYLGMVGYYSSTASFLDGYVIKSDLNGYSGCEDTLVVDSTRISYSVASLLDTIDTTYVGHIPLVLQDTLIDSLFCSGMGTTRMAGPSHDKGKVFPRGNIFPNPVHNGQVLTIKAEDEFSIQSLTLYNNHGMEVYKLQQDRDKTSCQIPINNMAPGLYLVKALEVNDTGDTRITMHKIVIE